jgi:transposase
MPPQGALTNGVFSPAKKGLTLQPAEQATKQGVRLIVVKLEEEKKRGFVLLPRRWVVERSFAWAARFRRLARDYERLPSSLAGLYWLAFLTLMLNSIFHQSA